jgi:hypothetical protein
MAETKKNTTGTAKKGGRPKKTAVVPQTAAEDDFFRITDAEESSEAPQIAVESVNEKKPETQESKKTYTDDEVQRMIAMAVAKAMQSVPTQPAAPQIIQVAADTEKVHFLWQAEVADDNVARFGEGGMYGQIVGKTGSFYVPKSELSRVLTERNRVFMKRRWLIVVSGLDDEEREALGVDYKDGEILDKRAFSKMIDLGDELLEIYPKLCDGHRKMVAQRWAEAYEAGNPNVTRERTVKLNEMSKAAGSARGDFTGIIERMNAQDAQ